MARIFAFSEVGAAPNAVTAEKTAAKPANPDTLLEPFTPPDLKDLDAKAKWEKQPVLDSMELLKAKLADAGGGGRRVCHGARAAAGHAVAGDAGRGTRPHRAGNAERTGAAGGYTGRRSAAR